MVLSSLKDELKANKPSGVTDQEIDDYLAYFLTFERMKYIIKIIVIIVLITSCSQEPEGPTTLTTLYNFSGHDIELQQFRFGEFKSSIIIGSNKSEEFSIGGGRGNFDIPFLPPFEADSIQIIYGELASIWHTKAANQVVSKSLLLESSYKGGKVKDGLYEFTYTFTEDDFQEAVDFGD